MAVDYINEHIDFAHGAEGVTRIDLLRRLTRNGARVNMSTALVAVRDGGAEIENTLSGLWTILDGRTVVLAYGWVADVSLARELSSRVLALHVIGDALVARRIVRATLEGARLANGT